MVRRGWTEVKMNAVSECGCVEYAGNYTFVPWHYKSCCLFRGRRTACEAKFAVSAFRAETVGQLELLAGLSGLGEAAETFRSVKVGGGVELRGRMAQDSALEGGGFSVQKCDVESDAFSDGGCAATTANGAAAKDDAGSTPGNLGLPPGFLVAREFSHLGEMFAKLRVPGFELR